MLLLIVFVTGCKDDSELKAPFPDTMYNYTMQDYLNTVDDIGDCFHKFLYNLELILFY